MAVQNLDTLEVSAEVEASMARLIERLGPVAPVCSQRWQPVVDKLGLGSTDGPAAGSTALVIGSPADVLKHARGATEAFGFVMPVAQMAALPLAPSRLARLGQRTQSWRDDATLDLWDLGWSPLNIDRLLVPMHDAAVELVIGDVCRVPEVQIPNG